MATQPITRLLLEWSAGDEFALEQLTPLVYSELRKLAGTYLGRERTGHTLQPTALVHEAYLRLVDQDRQTWESRSQFFGVAAHLMRLILVDWARKARAGKRGGGLRPVPIEHAPDAAWERPHEFIALDDALTVLDAVDPRKAKIVELLAVPVHAGDPRPLTADRIHHLYGRWLPDGRRIVFVGSEPGHGQRYYVQDSRDASPKPISGEDITFDRSLDDIVLSRDGRTLAVAMQDQSIRLLTVDGGESRVVRGGEGLTPVALCDDGSLLAYRSGDMPARIVRVDPASGRQELWKELAPAYRAGLWEIQPVRVASDCETYGYSGQYLPETVYVVSGLR